MDTALNNLPCLCSLPDWSRSLDKIIHPRSFPKWIVLWIPSQRQVRLLFGFSAASQSLSQIHPKSVTPDFCAQLFLLYLACSFSWKGQNGTNSNLCFHPLEKCEKWKVKHNHCVQAPKHTWSSEVSLRVCTPSWPLLLRNTPKNNQSAVQGDTQLLK